jgi:hypothetical protein
MSRSDRGRILTAAGASMSFDLRDPVDASFTGEAPAPIFVGLERLHDRMPRGLKVLGGVLVF